MNLKRAFGAIVVGLSACEDLTEVPQADAGLDATLDSDTDASTSDVANEATSDASADVAIDTYVDWCEAGPPNVLGGDSCYHYVYVPCGLPPADTIDDAGNVNFCNPICLGFTDDLCAVLPPPWPSVIEDAGLIDASSLVDGGVFVLCACTGAAGRIPEGLVAARVRARSVVGAYFAHGAHLEAASVVAFGRVHTELRSLGAPRTLLANVRRARRDERRHARVIGQLARRFGAPRVRVRVARFRGRSVEAMAHENAVEGCAREAFGALVATWQSLHAEDARVRRVLTRVARDETRHAELSYAIARFLDDHLDANARERVTRARQRALGALADSYDVPNDVVAIAGLPSPPIARRLARALAELIGQTREVLS